MPPRIEMISYSKSHLPRTRFYVFLSYTNREDEVKQVKPFVDQYVKGLWDWARQQGVEIFYDEFSLSSKIHDAPKLAAILAIAAKNSDLFTAFLSPGYVGSRWCRYEWEHGPLSPNRVGSTRLVHPIHWKPEYQNWHDGGSEQNFFPQTITPETVICDIDRRQVTDVTDAWESSTGMGQAVNKAVEDSISLIKSKYRRFPSDFETEA